MKLASVQHLRQLVKDNYEAIAADFDVTRRKKIWPKLAELSELVEGKSRVLDLGCGNGRLFEELKNKGGYYLGIDTSASLINIAKERYPEADWREGDMEKLDLILENNFDYIFCIAVLPHIPGRDNRVAALKKVKDKLSVGGQLIISAWNFWPQGKYWRPLLFSYLKNIFGFSKYDAGDLIFSWKHKVGEKGGERYYHAFTRREFVKELEDAGFKIISAHDDKQSISGQDRFNHWITAVKV